MITFRDWDKDDARKWFPISFMLVSVIYTGSKSLVSPVSLSTEELLANRGQFGMIAIPFSTGLHDLQESDNHLDRIRRGVMVRRNRHSFDSCLVRTHGEPETILS